MELDFHILVGHTAGLSERTAEDCRSGGLDGPHGFDMGVGRHWSSFLDVVPRQPTEMA